jgi:hypothetical protein
LKNSNIKIRNPKQHQNNNVDDLVKSQKCFLSVIPAKAGIQAFQLVTTALDPVFQRDDDFLRDHQCSKSKTNQAPGTKPWFFRFEHSYSRI